MFSSIALSLEVALHQKQFAPSRPYVPFRVFEGLKQATQKKIILDPAFVIDHLRFGQFFLMTVRLQKDCAQIKKIWVN